MAEMVVKTLRTAADGGTTVLCTIHQPSVAVFNMFDKLLLLSAGETAYFGPAKEALGYFASLGYQCPADEDPVEFMMSLVDATPEAGEAGSIESKELSQSRNTAVERAREVAAATPAPVDSDHAIAKSGRTYDSTWWEQLAALLDRELLVRKRSVALTKAVIGRTLFNSFLVGSIYFRVKKDQQGVFSINGALSFIIINQLFTYVTGQAVHNFYTFAMLPFIMVALA